LPLKALFDEEGGMIKSAKGRVQTENNKLIENKTGRAGFGVFFGCSYTWVKGYTPGGQFCRLVAPSSVLPGARMIDQGRRAWRIQAWMWE